MLIDSHCHFDFSAFDADRAAVWQRCRQAGVSALIIPGVAPAQWALTQQVSGQLAGVYHGLGVHPWWVDDALSATDHLTRCRRSLAGALNAPGCVALGECGLDALIDTPLATQIPVLTMQLELACELDKPLILHCRKAHNELLQLLTRHRPAAGGVVHAFSGSAELALQYWRLGFRLGIGGTITYPRANKTREAVRQLPLEALLLETDAPDMPLSGRQGQRNSPEYLPDIARALASLRGETLQRIAETTTANARQLFSLPL